MIAYLTTARQTALSDFEELTEGEFERLKSSHLEIEPNLTDRLRHELKKPPAFSAKIVSADSFLNLRLLDQNESHILTPLGKPHHLRAVTDLMRKNDWDLGKLKSEKLAERHDPEWFERCHVSDFDPDKSHWIAITPYKQNDCSLDGPFSIFEGQHRALSFAWFLSTGQISFSPRHVFVLLPRRWQFPAPEGS